MYEAIEKVIPILEKEGYLVNRDSKVKTPKKAAMGEEHPVYSTLEGIYNHNLAQTINPAKRMLAAGEISSAKAKA